MSGQWQSVGDGVHEWQQETGAKEDGTLTVVVRSVNQSTKYPHTCFDYNPNTGDLAYNHASFSKKKKSGMREVIQTAVSYLKEIGAL